MLSDDLRDNVVAKMPPADADRVHVIPNFVDTERDRADGPPHRLPGGAGDRGRSGRAVRGQRRLLPVARARGGRSASAARTSTFLINGDGAARSVAGGVRPRVSRTCGSPATSSRAGSASCSPPVTSTSCRCGPGSGGSACRRRRIRSWPPVARSWRRSTPARRSPSSWRSRAEESRSGPTIRWRSWRRSGRSSTIPPSARDSVRAGVPGSVREASPEAVGAAYDDLLRVVPMTCAVRGRSPKARGRR